jgi:UDP-N-acetylglucosamine 4-epimerase
MTKYNDVMKHLQKNKYTWLVTGVAGFIGSNILEHLLNLNQIVVGIDNFSTGHQRNLDDVKKHLGTAKWKNFSFINGDILKQSDCELACNDVDFVLHQAALGSVPRSIKDPIATNNVNITGFLNMLIAARDAKVSRFTYAASSSTYGDHPDLPKVEGFIGKPLSPYAVTKLVNELYAEVFYKSYNFSTIGLRYFNVFGKRQDPKGAYAAVIPKWIEAIASNSEVVINGDGTTSRDFCFVENAVQANILSVMTPEVKSGEIYNVAFGTKTSLNNLFDILKEIAHANGVIYDRYPHYHDFRPGDVRHSLANIDKIKEDLGYEPLYSLNTGLIKCFPWYLNN